MSYNTQKDSCVMASKKLKQLSAHVEKLGELLHTMMVVQGKCECMPLIHAKQDEICNEFQALYDQEGPASKGMEAYKQSIEKMGAAREVMHNSLVNEIAQPINEYLFQYSVMAKRMEEVR